ncbi:hypothetical protein C0J52_07569 [Blattella germanica]|nr:hypothetical protein C0J52_07569 [Blattella germanica]
MRQKTVSTCACLLFCLITIFGFTEALLRRCYTCRSRGDLGSCKDPFRLNLTLAGQEHGVEAVPCASGWCEYGVATERNCLQRGPSDNEERCDYITWNHKKVYMCFCQGDLCNGALPSTTSAISLVIFTAIGVFIMG